MYLNFHVLEIDILRGCGGDKVLKDQKGHGPGAIGTADERREQQLHVAKCVVTGF